MLTEATHRRCLLLRVESTWIKLEAFDASIGSFLVAGLGAALHDLFGSRPNLEAIRQPTRLNLTKKSLIRETSRRMLAGERGRPQKACSQTEVSDLGGDRERSAISKSGRAIATLVAFVAAMCGTKAEGTGT